MATSPVARLCAGLDGLSPPPRFCASLLYHDGDATSMATNVDPKAKRCGDGCFASARCGTRRRQSCKKCAHPQSCSNRTVREIDLDQLAIRRHLHAPFWNRPAATCAVVGSAASLLVHEHGPDIDAASVVIRVNVAPVRGFERHVGSRTDIRVWGAPMAPRRLREIAAIVPKDPTMVNPMKHLADLIGAETVVRYCGPNPWLSSCWKEITRDSHADPRFHPSAFRLASRLIHTNSTRCRRIGCVPTSGALAVLLALDRCKHTTVYGFGVDGDGGVPTVRTCRAGAADPLERAVRTSDTERRCWKSRTRIPLTGWPMGQ